MNPKPPRIAISFSLWVDPRGLPYEKSWYIRGWRITTAAARALYPGCTIILHCDKSIKACDRDLADKGYEWKHSVKGGMYWRFTSMGDPDYDVVMCRDADSIINQREVDAVQEWLDSGRKLHTMHEFITSARTRVLGGMWATRPGALPYDFAGLVRWVLDHKDPGGYGDDERFLNRYVGPYTTDPELCMNHWGMTEMVPYLNHNTFPGGNAPLTGYVGERIRSMPAYSGKPQR